MLRAIFFVAFTIAATGALVAAQTASPTPDDSCHITALIDTSAALGLPTRVERAFLLTLRTAVDACHQGELRRALTLLRTFSFEVRGVARAKRLRTETADMLLARTEHAIRYLSNAVHIQ
jgi:hypothetical protein